LLNDIELYEQVVIAKSGALIGLPLELCLISAQMSEWLPKTASVVEPFSIGYQILDDLNDLKEDVASDSKQRSLNAILVLEQLQGSDDPIKTARQLAREKFQQAAMSAKMLPKNVGHQFAELALYMADQV
jgi:geranylgeranyl diphosphate synthase type II